VLLALCEGRHVATRDGLEITVHAEMPRELAAEIRQALTLDGVFRDRFAAREEPQGEAPPDGAASV
jgi:hypothetical protein